jgi:hypothetical protein
MGVREARFYQAKSRLGEHALSRDEAQEMQEHSRAVINQWQIRSLYRQFDPDQDMVATVVWNAGIVAACRKWVCSCINGFQDPDEMWESLGYLKSEGWASDFND